MAPNNQSGRRPRPRVRRTRRALYDGSALSEAKQQAILRVMYQYSRFGPKQVHAELRRTRHDISLDMVRIVFQRAGRKEGVLARLFGR
jgi:predicted transcriptional regulator